MKRLNELRLKLVERSHKLEKDICLAKVVGEEDNVIELCAKYEEVQDTLKVIHDISYPPKKHLRIIKAG